MANQAPCLCEWTVYSIQGEGGPKIGTGRFTLVAAANNYRVDPNTVVGLSDVWKNLVFCPHGNADPIYKERALEPWSQGNDADWERAATRVRQAAKSTTKRLVTPYNGHELILWRCDRAVRDGTPLLVLHLVPPDIRQDGTGHGGHPP